MWQTKKFNGLHYSYYPEDEGNCGITAVCDETGEVVVLETENGCFTGVVLDENGLSRAECHAE